MPRTSWWSSGRRPLTSVARQRRQGRLAWSGLAYSAAHVLVCERPSVELGRELAGSTDEGEEVDAANVRQSDARMYGPTTADAGCTALDMIRLLSGVADGCCWSPMSVAIIDAADACADELNSCRRRGQRQSIDSPATAISAALRAGASAGAAATPRCVGATPWRTTSAVASRRARGMQGRQAS